MVLHPPTKFKKKKRFFWSVIPILGPLQTHSDLGPGAPPPPCLLATLLPPSVLGVYCLQSSSCASGVRQISISRRNLRRNIGVCPEIFVHSESVTEMYDFVHLEENKMIISKATAIVLNLSLASVLLSPNEILKDEVPP